MKRSVIALSLSFAIALTACAAKLGVTRPPTDSAKDPKGLVYRAPTTTIVVFRKDSYTADPRRGGKLCKTETTHEPVTLPLGDAYAVNVDNTLSWFAANEFSMSFNDQGVLKEVTLNSDPQLDETLTATAALVKEVAAVAAPGAAAAAGEPADGKCGDFVESEVACVKTADQWLANPHCIERQ